MENDFQQKNIEYPKIHREECFGAFSVVLEMNNYISLK